jgi:hypothetical protein
MKEANRQTMIAAKEEASLNERQYREVERMDEILQCTEEAREILVRRDRGEQFDPHKLKRLATHLAKDLVMIGNMWKYIRSVLTGEEIQLEVFSLKGKRPSRWMLPQVKRRKEGR